MGQDKYMNVIDLDGNWNGQIYCDESALDKPLHWSNPRKIFVCSMSDLFHPKVPFEFIDKVFDTMYRAAPLHIYQILTKRPERMKEWVKTVAKTYNAFWAGRKEFMGMGKNIWLGVSISTPDELDKIETLRRIPAAVRYISFEPLLADMGEVNLEGIDWVIIGAESKGSHPGRRCELEWVRNIVDQCDATGVPVHEYFVKQLHINGKLSKDPKQWPKWAQKQEYPK